MIVSDTIWQPNVADAGKSKYKSLAQAIREGIVSGQLNAGEKLPPVRELAYRVGVTPGTVARAYSVLIDEGRLVAGVGRGTYVAGGAASAVAIARPPIMLDTPNNAPDRVHLLSPKVPDTGQSQLIRDGMQALSRELHPEHLLRYPTRETDLAAREAFQNEVSPDSVGHFGIDDIVTAHGGQSAIVMILQTILHGANPVIAVDELSYGGFRSAALLCRAEVVPLPWDDEGPVVAVFEELIKSKSVQVYFTASEVCNPTVKPTAPSRRAEMARVAERYGVHIIDDDCYRLMKTDRIGPSYRALLPELGWYVSSPAKTLTAALRIGFAIAPQGWGQALVRTSTYHSFGVSRMITDLYAYMLARPELPEIIEGVKGRVAMDIRAAVNVLGGHRLNWSEDVPFLWLELPRGWRAAAFCKAAEASGVLIKPAEDFTLRDGRSVHAVRIAINGFMSHDAFTEAMDVLRRLLDQPAEQLAT
ncbi:aminotransferase-like domain-containing protein [Loktanella sp. Alg231-35]|uniref:aminotransferase-like domain-containing protein n=1 Tax=Loktanella sp. Alg231-35 TaxID=1922220 RepID=UPI000D560807|nr:PLP-dependent aminotransferase family protein [Loktanella sp. Alg231-35]